MEKIYVEILLSIVTLVIVPVLTQTARLVVAKVKNEHLQKALVEVGAAVGASVHMLEQTVVKELKTKSEDGKLSKEDAKKVLNMAVEHSWRHCSRSTLAYIQDNYGDITRYFVAQIEATIGGKK